MTMGTIERQKHSHSAACAFRSVCSSGAALKALGMVLLCLPPFLFPSYLVFQCTSVIIYAIAILGLNLLTGYNGQISIGHGAFFAIGAYVAAILMQHVGVPYWGSLPVSILICFGFGFAFGIPALRLEGHYLALATFALATAMPQMLKYQAVAHWTGGVQGMVLSGPDTPHMLKDVVNSDQWLYIFTLAIAAVAFWLARNLVRGRIGRAMVAIRDHGIAASAMGINVALTKSTIFGISAAYTGLAGALSAMLVQLVAPDSFTVFLSIALLVGAVIGGINTIHGAVFGAIFVQFVPNLSDEISKSAPWAIYGLLMIAVMFVMPDGVAGILKLLRYRIVTFAAHLAPGRPKLLNETKVKSANRGE